METLLIMIGIILVIYFIHRVVVSYSFESELVRLNIKLKEQKLEFEKFNAQKLEFENQKSQFEHDKLEEQKLEFEKFNAQKLEFDNQKSQFEHEKQAFFDKRDSIVTKVQSDITVLFAEKENSFPYFSKLISDYKSMIFEVSAKYLREKRNPAILEALRIKELQNLYQSVCSAKLRLEYKIELADKVLIENGQKGFNDFFFNIHNETISPLESRIRKLKFEIIPPLENRISKLKKEEDRLSKAIANSMIELNEYAKDIVQAFPKMSIIMSDYLIYQFERSAVSLAGIPYSQLSTSKKLTVLKAEKKSLLVKTKQLEYELAYIKSFFPEINDYIETAEGLESKNEEQTDPISNYLSKEEYSALTEAERNQYALERYILGQKSKWEIGRDYELYIGYLYRQKGYKVIYYGEYHGLNDLGRDLIVQKNLEIKIIQCKCWSKQKTIREKHINQLYGTAIQYAIEHNASMDNVSAVLITSTTLSDTAKKFASFLNVEVQENVDLGDFPRIKCNVKNKEKIYHLPFDQQYDKTKIENAGEFFVSTVKEAEELGFRRAWKWHSTQNIQSDS